MSILMPRIAARLFGEPLAIDAGKLQAILLGLGGRIVEGGVSLADVTAFEHHAFAAGRPSDLAGVADNRLGRRMEAAGRSPLTLVDNVAVIPVEGTLVHKGGFIGQSSGETSYEGIQTQLQAAMNALSVKGVVLEVDSGGGEVAGAFATASMIRQLSAAKPTLAILSDFALSAGYLLAAQARQIVMPLTGAAGSIGVVAMHADLSGKLEKDGVKVTLISSGAHKVAGHPAAPLAEDARADIQSRVDASRLHFANAVAAGRGPRLTAEAALATEARIYSGPDAVRAGLVDGIIDPVDAFRAFVARVNGGR